MELKTKFDIGDMVYYIDKHCNSGINIDKYIIDDLKIYRRASDDEITIQ